MSPQKIVVVGGGPIGALSALYAARRGYEVELYDLRDGEFSPWELYKVISLTYD
jgi:2-polyprenyl-6-methoxyphenol hydroxylase-like FAD-dependent oxidoreductase